MQYVGGEIRMKLAPKHNVLLRFPLATKNVTVAWAYENQGSGCR